MTPLILVSLLIFMPLGIGVVVLTLRLAERAYEQTKDERAATEVVTRWFSRYLSLAAIVMVIAYLYLTQSVLTGLLIGFLMSSFNLIWVVISYAVVGSLRARRVSGGNGESV